MPEAGVPQRFAGWAGQNGYIGRAARGIPRLVDRLAEHSMLVALRSKRTEIDNEVVTEAIDEVDP